MTDTYAEAKEAMDDLFAKVANLPDDETLRLRADTLRSVLDMFSQVMDDALDKAEENRALKDAVDLGDKLLAHRDAVIAGKEPLL